MENIIIMVDKNAIAYKKCSFQKIGNEQQNLQNKLKFEFEDEIVEGQAWLEFEIDGVKKYTPMEKYEKGYQIDIKNCLLTSDKVLVDLKITQDENLEGIPVFVTNMVEFDVEKTINAQEEEIEDYPSWIEEANKIINEANNLNLDINKNDKVSTITINKKDGTQKSVDVYDGKDGTQGVDGLSATIQVGNVTTLEPGENATVTNVGTENNAIFNFGIPKGEAGQDGSGGGTGNVSSDTINSIVVVDELPAIEEEGVLYLVKEIIETVINLYPSQVETTSSNGFTITFKNKNVIVTGSNSSSSVWGETEQFTMDLEVNKNYYLQFTHESGTMDDSDRITSSDGIVTSIILIGYDSSGYATNLINEVERDASGIYEKYTFTPTQEFVSYKLRLQTKKYISCSDWTLSIVIAEEGV